MLQQDLFTCDPNNTNLITMEQFKSVLEKNKIGPMNDTMANMLLEELDINKTGSMPYMDFLNSIFLTQLYIKEHKLYSEMKRYDTENKGGVTIGMLNEILVQNEEFQFPQDALQRCF